MTQIVVVTGITSFLGAHVALNFLQHGWTVRGTLRSESKKAAVLAIPEYKPYINSTLELWVTGDLINGDYTKVIKGATAVVHVASPVEFGDEEFRGSHLKPAVEGTRGVLEAAAKEESVNAVVMTSTLGAVGDFRQVPWEQVSLVIDENNWNPYTVEDMDKIVAGHRSKEAYPDGYLFYMTGKKYSELEAWKIQKESGAKWSLATMNCTMIWGPPIQPQTSLSEGGMSTGFVWNVIKGPKDGGIMPAYYPYYVDVRDAAEAHYQAIIRGAQGRYLLSAEAFDFQEMADMAREWYPEREDRITLGKPGNYTYKDPGVYTLLNDKSKKELGITYRPKTETFKDAMDKMLALEKQGFK